MPVCRLAECHVCPLLAVALLAISTAPVQAQVPLAIVAADSAAPIVPVDSARAWLAGTNIVGVELVGSLHGGVTLRNRATDPYRARVTFTFYDRKDRYIGDCDASGSIEPGDQRVLACSVGVQRGHRARVVARFRAATRQTHTSEWLPVQVRDVRFRTTRTDNRERLQARAAIAVPPGEERDARAVFAFRSADSTLIAQCDVRTHLAAEVRERVACDTHVPRGLLRVTQVDVVVWGRRADKTERTGA